MKAFRLAVFAASLIVASFAQASDYKTLTMGLKEGSPNSTIGIYLGGQWYPILDVSTTGAVDVWRKTLSGSGQNATATGFSPANQSLYLQGSLTGNGLGPYALIAPTDTATNTTSGAFINGLWVSHVIGAGAGEGSRNAFMPTLTIANPLPCTSGAHCFHSASFPQTYVSANLGGDSGTSKGDVYGNNGLAQLESGATYVNGVTGGEFDTSVQSGASVKYKSVVTVASVNSDAVKGSTYDAMMTFIRDNTTLTPWTLGIGFGRPDSTWPFDSSSTIIGTTAPGTGSRVANYGVDLRDVAFSTCAFAADNFCANSKLLSLLSVPSNDFYSNLATPPAVSKLGDRIQIGDAIGMSMDSTSQAYTDLANILGTNLSMGWMPRDATMNLVNKGQIGYSVVKNNYLINGNNALFRSAFGFTAGVDCAYDAGASGTTACESFYGEVVRRSQYATALGMELAVANAYGPATTTGPYASNYQDSTIGINCDTHNSTEALTFYVPQSCLTIVSVHRPGFYAPINITTHAVYGTNGKQNYTVNVTYVNGSKNAQLDAGADIDLVQGGQYVSVAAPAFLSTLVGYNPTTKAIVLADNFSGLRHIFHHIPEPAGQRHPAFDRLQRASDFRR
ncbi:hypothetical protein [Methylocystis sp. S23]